MRFAVPLLLALASSACTKTGTQVCPSQDRPSARSQLTAVLVPSANQIYALGGEGVARCRSTSCGAGRSAPAAAGRA